MSGKILDGKALAQKIRESLPARVEAVKKANGRPPRLAILTGPEQPASKSYLDAKTKACGQIGIEVSVARLDRQANPQEALEILGGLNRDGAIDAIVIDLPLPPRVSPLMLYGALEPAKDAEGMSLAQYGRLFMSSGEFRELRPPCTAEAIVRLLLESHENLKGKRAAVVGRSAIVGRPAAQLLSLLDLTVTTCHTKTVDLQGEIGRADVVVACAGKAGLIAGSWIKEGAILIDAGINYKDGRLVGDVEFEAARTKASWITPVPGGVGPVTTAILLSRIVQLAQNGQGEGARGEYFRPLSF